MPIARENEHKLVARLLHEGRDSVYSRKTQIQGGQIWAAATIGDSNFRGKAGMMGKRKRRATTVGSRFVCHMLDSKNPKTLDEVIESCHSYSEQWKDAPMTKATIAYSLLRLLEFGMAGIA